MELLISLFKCHHITEVIFLQQYERGYRIWTKCGSFFWLKARLTRDTVRVWRVRIGLGTRPGSISGLRLVWSSRIRSNNNCQYTLSEKFERSGVYGYRQISFKKIFPQIQLIFTGFVEPFWTDDIANLIGLEKISSSGHSEVYIQLAVINLCYPPWAHKITQHLMRINMRDILLIHQIALSCSFFQDEASGLVPPKRCISVFFVEPNIHPTMKGTIS